MDSLRFCGYGRGFRVLKVLRLKTLSGLSAVCWVQIGESGLRRVSVPTCAFQGLRAQSSVRAHRLSIDHVSVKSEVPTQMWNLWDASGPTAIPATDVGAIP